MLLTRMLTCNTNLLQVHSFLITNLALGDLLMGTYLLLIALVDCHYRGVYFIHDSAWRSSKLCAFAGFLSTFSSELSVFTLTGKQLTYLFSGYILYKHVHCIFLSCFTLLLRQNIFCSMKKQQFESKNFVSLSTANLKIKVKKLQFLKNMLLLQL